MTGLLVDVDIAADADLYGKVVSDLQSGIVIDGDAITGTLKYIDDYTEYLATFQTLFDSEDEAIQDSEERDILTRELLGISLRSGNFLALHAEVPEVDGVTITAKVRRTVPADENGNAVVRITNKNSQTVAVVASKPGYPSVTRRFSLTELTIETGA